MSFNRPYPPHPPVDPVLRNKIEGLAAFVVSSGYTIDEAVRTKLMQNPAERFNFLNSNDPYNPYFRYRLDYEVNQIKEGPPPANNFDPDAARMQIAQLEHSIQQSEQNLNAQRDSIPFLKESQFMQLIIDEQNKKVANHLQSVGLDVAPLADILQDFFGKASKEKVVAAKKWILDTCRDDRARELVLMYLLHRLRELTSTDSFRIHVLYLINDWAYHCQRKKLATDLQILSRYVPRMYSWTSEVASDRMMVNDRIEKLLGTWEGHNFFNEQCFRQLRNPAQVFGNDKTALQAEYAQLSQKIEADLNAMLAGYQQQHNDFCKHQMNIINDLQRQINAFERQKETPQSLFDINVPPPPQEFENRRRSRFDQGAPQNFNIPPPAQYSPPKETQEEDIDGIEYVEEDLIPKCEYWDTPAGLMKNQIDIVDVTYKAIDPSTIRLEPSMPPSTSLLQALDMFYASPPAAPPRDNDGWELNALSSFFERKAHIKSLQTDQAVADGKLFEDLIVNKMTQEDRDEEFCEMERVRQDALEEQEKQNDLKKSGSPSSQTSSSSRSRSRGRKRSRRSSESTRSSKSRSSSRSSRSRSASPIVPKSPLRSEDDYIPPINAFRSSNAPAAPLGMDNKGAMLMAKMGWRGTGLGAKETGIQVPINAGEIRDKESLYKGLGQREDAYTEFRKQVSSGWHKRNNLLFNKQNAAQQQNQNN